MSLERRPIVYAGPSLAMVPDADRARLDVRPPVRRGDLEALLASSEPRTVLLVDGLFGGSLAVAPMECRHLLERGYTVCGASSIGALRASELWSLGMIGIGEIYAMLRVGGVVDDDELAVAYHPETYEEMTASLVHVRALLAGVPATTTDRKRAVEVARTIHWMERSWKRLYDAWRRSGVSVALVESVRAAESSRANHPKLRDARLAVQCVLEDVWPIATPP